LRRVRRSDRETDWGLWGGFRSVDRLWVGTGLLSTVEMVGIEENWTLGFCWISVVVNYRIFLGSWLE
jgi:hypothetical protein